MARWFLLVLALAAVICFAQALPVTADETTTSTQGIGIDLEKLKKTVSDGIDNIKNDPKINEYLEAGQKALNKIAQQLKEQADKIIPKTDGITVAS